jgi:hypothetical protein
MEPIVERVDLLIDLRKPYEKPEIIQELELETRAGSPNRPSRCCYFYRSETRHLTGVHQEITIRPGAGQRGLRFRLF